MRRSISASLAVGSTVLTLVACGYEPEIERPGAATGGTTPATAAPNPSEPTSTTPRFTAGGCPVDDPAFCEQAAFLANALVLADGDAVFDLSRPTTIRCGSADDETFPQCDDATSLQGYVVGGYHDDELFVEPARRHRRTLRFLVEAVDEEYTDELGGPEMQVLGVSPCGTGARRSYHLVYLVGLGDPESTLPGARFLGTYEFTRQGGRWAIDVAYAALYTDWQLVMDDPLAQIACGDVRPWAAEAGPANPPGSESQPTPSPSAG